MKKYLIDTNISIFYIKGKYDLYKKFETVEVSNCFISEITLAELKFGIENSECPEKNKKTLADFLTGIKVIPIFNSLDFYAKEKTRLRTLGTLIDDFDLLIDATAVVNRLVMVTNSINHFKRIKNIDIEDWTIINK